MPRIQRPSIFGFMLALGREPRISIGVRLVASLLAPMLALGVALLTVYLASGYRGLDRIDFDTEQVVASIIAATVFTTLAILWIWRPLLARTTRLTLASTALHLLLSGAIIFGCVLITAFIDRRSWLVRDEEFLVIAIWMIGVPLAITPWAALAVALTRGRTFDASARETTVVCPSCGYSLAGLRQASCPECGSDFTLEQLFESQGYAAPESAPEMESGVTASSDGTPAAHG